MADTIPLSMVGDTCYFRCNSSWLPGISNIRVINIPLFGISVTYYAAADGLNYCREIKMHLCMLEPMHVTVVQWLQ